MLPWPLGAGHGSGRGPCEREDGTMHDDEWLASAFEQHRPRLRAVAYRMLGSFAEADDAVQDTWLRLSRSQGAQVHNLGGWLTTVLARVCLNLLRSRTQRREESLDAHLPDPILALPASPLPDEQAVLADSVGLALMVVLDTLSPDERLVFVLHDMFEVPFEQIAGIVGRTPNAAKQLASRARRRVAGAQIPASPDVVRQREVVDAFFTAARRGDFEALVAVLHPDVQLRTDTGTPATSMLIRGAAAVSRQVGQGLRGLLTAPPAQLHPAVVAGSAGAILTMHGRPVSVIAFTVADNAIRRVDAIADVERLERMLPGFSPLPTGQRDRRPPA
ncbi:sigma-70 family RNA polymerase sigma factor [Dactylosporangium sp. CA-139114]|uniref:sigma-70 family RNA polymerase sigma factor n=1 Tax=Dactylosporangium sp. CA-139114 TaxID=3239931 RepID=UPI003D98B5CC